MLRETFPEITNSLPEPYFLLDQKGHVISFNQTARKKFPILSAGSNSLSLELLSEEDPARIKQLLQMWSRSKSPLPARVLFKNGGEAVQQYQCKGNTVRPARQGEPALIMLQCTDKRQSTAIFVTLNEKVEQLKREVIQRRNAEQEILQLNLGLEQRVKDRTRELQQANTELSRSLEELQKAQDQLVRTERLASLGSMVAGVAHEINTPVGICVTAASFMQEQSFHFQKQYQQNRLTQSDFESFLDEIIESSGIVLSNLGRAADLVRSFKQLAVDQTSNENREINMKSYVEELMISLRPYFRHTSHNFKLDCADDINIRSQPGAIAQIISNLINNSITHGFDGIEQGLIKIKFTQQNGSLLLHYSDNGVGICSDNINEIFDPFFTTRRNQGGSGLGMSIVYNLVTTRLAGEISLSSEQMQGVNFYIKIPVERLD